MSREFRFIKGKVELRGITEDQIKAGYIGTIQGFIPYDSESRELRDRTGRKFVERMARGAFSKSVADTSHTIFADVGHNDAATFARRGVNLEVSETDAGIAYTALLPDTTVGRDLKKNVELGIIDGTSFEFEVRDEPGAQIVEKRDAISLRTIKSAILHRLNPVTEPAYLESTLAARSCQLPDEEPIKSEAPISHNSTGLVGALVGFF